MLKKCFENKEKHNNFKGFCLGYYLIEHFRKKYFKSFIILMLFPHHQTLIKSYSKQNMAQN